MTKIKALDWLVRLMVYLVDHLLFDEDRAQGEEPDVEF